MSHLNPVTVPLPISASTSLAPGSRRPLRGHMQRFLQLESLNRDMSHKVRGSTGKLHASCIPSVQPLPRPGVRAASPPTPFHPCLTPGRISELRPLYLSVPHGSFFPTSGSGPCSGHEQSPRVPLCTSNLLLLSGSQGGPRS